MGNVRDRRATRGARRLMTIYVQLLNEGTDVWRPVEATQLSDNTYSIEGTVPGGEEWAFAPGSVVRCVSKTFSTGATGLAAVSRA